MYFFPRPVCPTGIVAACISLCVCVSMCVSFNRERVCVITHHTFQLESPNLDPKLQSILIKVPISLGGWLALIFRDEFNFISKSCLFTSLLLFETFVRRAKSGSVELFHILHGSAYIWFLYHWGQPREATVVKMAPMPPLASRSFFPSRVSWRPLISLKFATD